MVIEPMIIVYLPHKLKASATQSTGASDTHCSRNCSLIELDLSSSIKQ